MPRTIDPFKNINWQTAPPLHDLYVSIGEHFSDARAGHPLATNELVEDCLIAFKALGILPHTITAMISSVYNTTIPAVPKQEAPVHAIATPPVVATTIPEKEKKGFFSTH